MDGSLLISRRRFPMPIAHVLEKPGQLVDRPVRNPSGGQQLLELSGGHEGFPLDMPFLREGLTHTPVTLEDDCSQVLAVKQRLTRNLNLELERPGRGLAFCKNHYGAKHAGDHQQADGHKPDQGGRNGAQRAGGKRFRRGNRLFGDAALGFRQQGQDQPDKHDHQQNLPGKCKQPRQYPFPRNAPGHLEDQENHEHGKEYQDENSREAAHRHSHRRSIHARKRHLAVFKNGNRHPGEELQMRQSDANQHGQDQRGEKEDERAVPITFQWKELICSIGYPLRFVAAPPQILSALTILLCHSNGIAIRT